MRQNSIKPVLIGNKMVGLGHTVFIVLEIGINHNGFMKIVKDLIDLAVVVGADAVKFQTRTVEVVYAGKLDKPRPTPKVVLENAIARGVLSPEAVARLQDSDFENATEGDQKRALELTLDEYREIDRYCKEKGIMWFTSCWDTEALKKMIQHFPDMPCHKIASACNEDDELLVIARDSGKPIIMSTGMTDLAGIREAVNIVGRDNLILMHCTSVYPTGLEEDEDILKQINLLGIATLIQEFGVPVGFSSHESGIMPCYAAAAAGACMIEKHYTLRRSMYGSDQASSANGSTVQQLCQMMRELPLVMGDGKIVIYPSEQAVADKLRRVKRPRLKRTA